MTSIVEADDEVVAVALQVLDGDAPEGRKNIRRGTESGGTEFVYRLDDEAVDGDEVDPENVREDGEFPDADVAMWRANRNLVEREIERREIEGQDDPIGDKRLEENTRER